MKKRIFVLAAALLVLFGLAGCASKPEMPMEIVVDGFTIVLGQTTVEDMTQRGYSVNLNSTPSVATNKQEYLPFSLSMDRGAGDQLYVMVYVPWNGETDIREETKLAVTQGVIYAVTAKVSATSKIEVVYDGLPLQEMSFEQGMESWGCKEKSGSSTLTYELEAQTGLVEMQAASTTGKEFAELTVKLSYDVFLKMQ